MSRQLAETAIEKHLLTIFDWGVRLGAPTDTLTCAGYGGFYRSFEHGRVYWHPDTGARAVHGAVLDSYLERGGPGKDPVSGRRELGFPKGDEQSAWDRRRRMVELEHGAIYERGRFDSPGRKDPGGVAVQGRIWLAYQELGRELGPLGYPLTETLRAAGFEGQFFERGCLLDRADLDAPLVGRLRTARWGEPSVTTAEDRGLSARIAFELSETAWERLGRRPAHLVEAWDGRLSLTPSRDVGATERPRTMLRAVCRSLDETLDCGARVRIEIGLMLPKNAHSLGTGLYDLVTRSRGRETVVVAHRAVYFKGRMRRPRPRVPVRAPWPFVWPTVPSGSVGAAL